MIIVLVGGIGTGKSTVADYLKQKNFAEETFSSPIKQFAVSIGFHERDVYGTQNDKNKPNEFWKISGRQFMQRFGTDVMRNFSHLIEPSISNIWIKIMENKVLNAIEKGQNIVISDCRFEDEFESLKKYGVISIRLKRNLGEVSLHSSETNFDKIQTQYVYENNKSKSDLFRFIDKILYD